jgi:hypothetical protein
MKKIFAAFIFASAFINSLFAVTTPPASKPNIIFILADDLGYGDVGVFYQNSRPDSKPKLLTPELDAMAAQGLMFRQHYSASPVCAPARASLLLGQHQGNCVIRDNQFDKALPHNHTLATVLAMAGYDCAVIGKWGLAGQPDNFFPPVYDPAMVSGYPLQHGFNEFFGFVDHAAGHVYYHDANIRSTRITPMSPRITKIFTRRICFLRGPKNLCATTKPPLRRNRFFSISRRRRSTCKCRFRADRFPPVPDCTADCNGR